MIETLPLIAFDLDEVLARHNEALLLFHNQRYGTNNVLQDYISEHDLYLVWGTTVEEAGRRAVEFHETGAHSRLEMMPGSHEALTRLHNRYRHAVITQRRKMIVEPTHIWLDGNYSGLIDYIRFIHAWEDPNAPAKIDVMDELGAEWLVDDSLRHCKLVAEAGKRALLFGNYPWNQTTERLSPRITRVADWTEVEAYFESRDVLVRGM